MGAMAPLNKMYGWNMPGVRETAQKAVIAAEELPKLGNVHNEKQMLIDRIDDV